MTSKELLLIINNYLTDKKYKYESNIKIKNDTVDYKIDIKCKKQFLASKVDLFSILILNYNNNDLFDNLYLINEIIKHYNESINVDYDNSELNYKFSVIYISDISIDQNIIDFFNNPDNNMILNKLFVNFIDLTDSKIFFTPDHNSVKYEVISARFNYLINEYNKNLNRDVVTAEIRKLLDVIISLNEKCLK